MDQAKFKATHATGVACGLRAAEHPPYRTVSGIDTLFPDVVAASPSSPGFIGPDQAALEDLSSVRTVAEPTSAGRRDLGAPS